MSSLGVPVLLAVSLLSMLQLYELDQTRADLAAVQASITTLRQELGVLRAREATTACREPTAEARALSEPTLRARPLEKPAARMPRVQRDFEQEQTVLAEARAELDRMWSSGLLSAEGIAALRRLEVMAPHAEEWAALRSEIIEGINSGRLEVEDPMLVMF